VKRMLLIIAAAILLANTVVVPTVVRADNGTGKCDGICKP
jgi:hypothetical protein